MLIYTLCNRCCPTERYIRTVRIPGDLCANVDKSKFRAVDKITKFMKKHNFLLILTESLVQVNRNII